MGVIECKQPMCIVGIVTIIRARHSAKIRAKSLIVSEKSFFNHRAPMQLNGSFGPKINLPASLIGPILKEMHAVQF
jgi:hypothetical protein